MTDQHEIADSERSDPPVADECRRTFLRGLGKWSQAVIGGVLLGGALTESSPAHAWAAARGYRGYYRGGGGAWVNGGGGYYRGGGSWINGGGGGWINRYGGGSWINR